MTPEILIPTCDLWPVIASFLASTAGAYTALWVASSMLNIFLAGAALLTGAAVCTMHYTGMAAASVVCTTSDRLGLVSGGLLRPRDLSFYVILVAIAIASMIVMDVMMQRLQHRAQAAR